MPTNATVYTSGSHTADPRDNTTLGMGLLFKEVLVTGGHGWTEPYASSSPYSMIQAPEALGGYVIQFDHTNAAYTIVKFASGASAVDTLTGVVGPIVNSSYIINYNSTSSDTIWFRFYIGPRGDFAFLYLFGNQYLTSGLVAGRGFSLYPHDTTDFFVLSDKSTSVTSGNRTMLAPAGGGGGGMIAEHDGSTVGYLVRLYFHVGGDPSGYNTPWASSAVYPGTTDVHVSPFEVHEYIDPGCVRSILHGFIGIANTGTPSTTMDLSGTLPTDGEHTLTVPAGFMGLTTSTNLDVDCYIVYGTVGRILITDHYCMWPQA